MAENMDGFVERLIEMWNTGNGELASQVYSEDCERFDPRHADPLRGPAEIAKYVTEIRAAFPDFRIEITRRITEGDTFVHCWKCTGTQKGEFQGIPPTGNAVHLAGVSEGRVKDGRIQQERSYYDRLALLEQLGVAPSQPGPAA